jgi:hypothetical protein
VLTPVPTRSRAAARHTRLVDRLSIHGEPVSFRELCRRAVPQDTRYLVLDLDRTVHLGRNMGELLGWELCARSAYGLDGLARAEDRRPPGRFFLDPSRPAATLRYLATGLRMWAVPGLLYLFTGKLPSRFEPLRRRSFRALGPEPVATAQRVPQIALLHHLAEVPAAELRVLARSVWDRHRADQVIEREDLAWLRSRCPGLRIVIASASPQPMVEVAAEALGADDAICSTVEEHGGRLSAPPELRASLLPARAPRRLSSPSRTWINSGRSKIEALLARYPDLADASTVSVGVTDTGYGEDHSWADHLTHVVDVNSSTPFPPVVRASSPLREIHSASVLTRAERERRATHAGAQPDRRRPGPVGRDRVYGARELGERLAEHAGRIEALATQADDAERGLAGARDPVLAQLGAATARVEALVAAYNDGAASARRAAWRDVVRELELGRRLRRTLARVERPLADLSCSLTRLLAASRAALAEEAPPGAADELPASAGAIAGHAAVE